MAILSALLIISKLVMFFSPSSSETDSITQFEPLPFGKTLVNGTFELGFFTPGSSPNCYLGIWFKNIPVKTVVWVANRDNPIRDNSTKLSISREGNLVLLSENGTVHWSTNLAVKAPSVTGQLLGSGNFVLMDSRDNKTVLWQSFDYPTDTILPEMKIGLNLTSGLNRIITAWNNWNDPSSGHLTYGFMRSNIPELEIWNGSSMLYRSAPWNGVRYGGTPAYNRSQLVNIDFKSNKDEYYFTYKPGDASLISRVVINQTVYALQRFIWNEENRIWELNLHVPRDGCDYYKRCGSFGNCGVMDNDKDVPLCECLSGFEPKSPQNWSAKVWGEGCGRSGRWKCRDKKRDGFIEIKNLKIPETKTAWIDRSMTLEKCKARCWENCFCTAYANSYKNGSGCILWFGDLLDMRQLPDAGQDLYVRLDVSQTANQRGSKNMVVVITCIASSVIAMLVIIFTCIYWRSGTKFRDIIKTKVKRNQTKQEDLELPLFDFDTIACATNDFSSDNKLGEGGFGPVYRGTLLDGQDIAVKRLSHTSTQGLEEFKNEVILCSKLQHRNLVKIIGCCINEEEKLLIYEYMPNKSLDVFLFDSSRCKLLDWSRRFNIINGIARGLLYLHQDSRLRIIHRDLKASNILLDYDMNPKISDFGLARMCRGDQIEGNTSKIVGTYGYMAPEFAIDGIFSIKSDVYSFGILLLELLSGKKNRRLSYSYDCYNLIGHAWRLWKECVPMEFIDTCLGDSYVPSEALRCIHIGLLCVQNHPDDRPNMTSVVIMLTSESALPQPKEPVFLVEKGSVEESISGQKMHYSTNEITMSMLEPR